MRQDFDSIADELYGLRPGEFTAARDAFSLQARRAGDVELAGSVKALKRPSVSAWLANSLVRDQGPQIDELIGLGAAMRDAQARLAGDELRQLSQQRRQVISALTNSARQLAGVQGQQISSEAERELVATLEAALADPTAGAALRAGRLVSTLTISGIESLDQSDPPSSPVPGRATSTTNNHRQAPDTADPKRTKATPRVTGAAARELAEAEEAAGLARHAADEQGRRKSAVRDEQRRLREEMREATAWLEALQVESADLAQRLREVTQAHSQAERGARAAEQRAVKARRAAH
jgi:hypothetical protein